MKAKFIKKQPETSDSDSYFFETSEPVSWVAGQYLNLELPDLPPGEKERLFTISAAPLEKTIRITTRQTGTAFKKRLLNLEVDTEVEIDQIGGDFIWTVSDKPLVFLAGGIGITPFRSMLTERHLEGQPLSAALVYGNRTEEFVFDNELQQLQAEHPELTIHKVVDQHVTAELVGQLVPNYLDCEVYTSGPDPMVEALGEDLLQHGLSKAQWHKDAFTGYHQSNY